MCCWSGDDVAQYAAESIRRFDWLSLDGDRERIKDRLQEFGQEAWNRLDEDARKHGLLRDPGTVRRVLAAFGDMLFLLEIYPTHSIANQRLDRAVSGDCENTARYFMNNYGAESYHKPVDKLITLAAFTIVAAGEENPHGVGGLEMVITRKNCAPVFLSPDEENALKRRAHEISANIESMILGSTPITSPLP